MAFGMKDVLNSAKTMAGAGGSSLLQGGLNNYSEVSAEQLMQEYGMYLMDGENIVSEEELSHLDVQTIANKRAEEFERLVTKVIGKF